MLERIKCEMAAREPFTGNMKRILPQSASPVSNVIYSVISPKSVTIRSNAVSAPTEFD